MSEMPHAEMSPPISPRDAPWPLIASALLALLIHAALVPLWALVMLGGLIEEPAAPTGQTSEPNAPIKLGQERSEVASVAWIAYEDFRKLQASRSKTRQPALQQEIEPVEHAPVELDPTPPAPSASELTQAAHQAAPSSGEAGGEAAPFAGSNAGASSGASSGGGEPSWRVERDGPFASPVEQASASTPGRAVDLSEPVNATASQLSARASEPRAAGQPARPTAAPRSDRESAPVDLTNHALVARPGQVLTAEGLEVKTARPEFSMVARSSSLPVNPVAEVIFDVDGQVIHAELLESSGVANVDGPILSSLYKWRLTGEKLEQVDRPVRIEVKLLLVED